jgi:hypothetical protein
MQRSYIDLDFKTFLKLNESEIMGKLTKAHLFALDLNQKRAWEYQVKHLKRTLAEIKEEGRIYFEFSIPRMGKRVDNILLIENIVFVLEYKVGANQPDSSGLDQAHDYSLDLKNFHLGSHHKYIVPILIPTETDLPPQSCNFADDKVAFPTAVSPEKLTQILIEVTSNFGSPDGKPEIWASSGYKPTPTIVEAAKALFSGHSVKEITRSEAGAKNLQETATKVLAIIKEAKTNKKKSVIFVTGVPGSGKTLAGLEIATSSRRASHSEDEGVFLTGNGPLADVLREALARDEVERNEVSKKAAMQKAKTFVQNIHHFRDEYLSNVNPPHEKVVVFDEAQRAWNLSATRRFMNQKRGINDFEQSEPEFLLSVMARHEDWCVVICLIGNGQEINSGEAGVAEWVKAVEKSNKDWTIYFSSKLYEYEHGNTSELFNKIRPSFINKYSELHLGTSIRSFRSERLSEYIGKVLEGETQQAKEVLCGLNNYPLYISRNLPKVKKWLKEVSRGSERYGLVSSSNAIRLKPYGLNMKSKIDPTHWFLSNKQDIRSSYYLEDAASEFEIQGLELDWVGLCWDANLRRNDRNWEFYSFKGTKWQNNAQTERQFYLLNSYRVLMTRARQGMVIFVPEGDKEDDTRKPEFYDPIYEYLLSCGFKELN